MVAGYAGDPRERDEDSDLPREMDLVRMLVYVAGVLEEASALCALTNPTVNSYKRLNASGTNSGSTWSPAAATASNHQ